MVGSKVTVGLCDGAKLFMSLHRGQERKGKGRQGLGTPYLLKRPALRDRTPFRKFHPLVLSHLPQDTVQVLGIELKSPGLAVGAFILGPSLQPAFSL